MNWKSASAESFCRVISKFMGEDWANAVKQGAKPPLPDCPLCAGVGYRITGPGSSDGSFLIASCDCVWRGKQN